MKLSFAIVTYNNAKIIERTLENLLSNIPSKFKYEFFVIDNNSTDNTCEIIEKNFKKIKLIKLKENKGFGYGHNTIMEFLDSDYHFVVNPDILIENSTQIDVMIEYLEDNQDIGLLSPLILNPDHSIQYLCKKNPTVFDMLIRRISPRLFRKRQDNYVMMDSGYNKIMPIEYASGSFMVFRTRIFININGFDINFFMYLEDADITRRVNQVSKSIFFPLAYVIHEWERANYKSLKFIIITVKSMNIYFNKWRWRLF